MPLFDAPRTPYPRNWSEQSFDYRLFFVWMISLFVQIPLMQAGLIGGAGSPLYFAAVGVLAAGLVLVALARRRRDHWRWPGLCRDDVWRALYAAVSMAIFLFVFVRVLLSGWPKTAPMILFASSIGLGAVLNALRVLQFSQAEYELYCVDPSNPPPPAANDDAGPIDPAWKRIVRGVVVTALTLVWLEMMGWFYLHDRFMEEGSRVPTAAQNARIEDGGTVVYVSPRRERIDTLMRGSMMFAAPISIGAGFLAYFVLGIQLAPNMPRRRGIFDPATGP